MNGRQDDVFPPAGGVDNYDEWISESQTSIITDWAKTQGCDLDSMERVVTPYDNYEKRLRKGYNLHCFQYTKGCSGKVMQCAYKGTHANYVAYDAQLVTWYLPWFKTETDEQVNESFAIVDENPQGESGDFF